MGLFGTIKPGLRKSEAAILHLDLLGSLSIKLLDGTTITPTGAKTRGLLAILALSDRRPVTRKNLAHLLWSRRSDEQARASLRQEIHRLAEALSPLGTDILDTQRHALALKPVLTLVDAERYLNATPSGILKLPETDAALLTDLDAVDPALDEWLTAQRTRLRAHLISTLEQAQITLQDPEQRIVAANRILRLDRLNENAWKVLLRELGRTGDTSAALFAAEQCLVTFRDTFASEPGSAIMALIQELRSPQAGDRQGNTESSRHEREDVTQSLRDAYRATGNSRTVESWAALSRTVASIGFASRRQETRSPKDVVLENVLELTATGLTGFDFLSVFPPASTPHAADGETKSLGDYLIGTKLQTGSPPGDTSRPLTRLIVRVTDERRDGVIIWAERFTLTNDNFDELAAIMTTEIGWRIAMAEARNSAHRGAEDLSPLEAGLRAFAVLNRKNTTDFPQIESLMDSALRRDPDHPFLLLVFALFNLVRFREEWSATPGGPDHSAAIDTVRRMLAAYPETLPGRLLLARLLLDRPAERTAALRLLEETRIFTPAHGVTITLEAYAELVSGHPEAAALRLDSFRRSHPTHPCVDLFDADFVLIFLLGGRISDAIERSRISLCITPTRPVMLALHLAALVALQTEEGQDTSSEQAIILSQLRKLEPSFSLAMVDRHCSFLPPALCATLCTLMMQAGIPETSPVLNKRGQGALGVNPATGYESASVAPSSSVP
ncbi:AfsR/SARP family transcriptional regulator [Acetobacter conturbans]|uniref:Helix-turn-helix domain-containing protein n=1 Tax=Acetobacter conturbans TaxID=1737472 RepID=A0ABX0JXX2_9PROT|nr:BTAD domain-containing putative transcriptional regulator [Acetobacter conturbans]NHN88321.1 helix-turn-helix domain-containing protein [Acetobacter conturbans]